MWVLNAKSSIEQYSGGLWNPLPITKAHRLGVTSSGTLAVVQTSGKLLLSPNIGKNRCFRDIALGQYGEIYALGCKSTRAGYIVMRYRENLGWKRMKGGGVAIAVDSSGDPWVINKRKSLFKWNDGEKKWEFMGLKQVREVASGPEGMVYVLAGPRLRDGSGYRMYRWAGDDLWYPIPGQGAIQVAVGKFGRPYIVDGQGRILVSDCNGSNKLQIKIEKMAPKIKVDLS